jgi:hypothetical protein
MRTFIGNAFSLQMCRDFPANIHVDTLEEIPNLSECISIIGHQDLANILGVPMNRESIKLQDNDVLIVAQVMGGRLPEGSTTLPEGVTIQFLKVTLECPLEFIDRTRVTFEEDDDF